MIEAALLFVLAKIGLSGVAATALVYLVLQLLKKGVWTTLPKLWRELKATIVTGWAALATTWNAAYEDGEITEQEAVDIYQGIMGVVTRAGMTAIQLFFLVVPVRSIAWLLGRIIRRKAR